MKGEDPGQVPVSHSQKRKRESSRRWGSWDKGPGDIKLKKESLEGRRTSLRGNVRASGPEEDKREGKSGVVQSLRSPVVGSRIEQRKRDHLRRVERGLRVVPEHIFKSIVLILVIHYNLL